MTEFTISLKKIIESFSLTKIQFDGDVEGVEIKSSEINRPGIQFAGFYDFFDNTRIQIIGKTEEGYVKKLDEDAKKECYDKFFALKPVLVILARGMKAGEYMQEAAKKYGVPLYSCETATSELEASLMSFLKLHLAPRITRHGVLVEGILMLGESGVGKSETAIELIKRGHRLIADDAVEIRKVSSKSLVGSAPENIRHFIELRGIGIINASRIFGVGAVKLTEKIDMVMNIEPWDNNKVYDRMGLEEQKTEILGIEVPSVTIPVRPGRNLAVIIEVAAMNNRQKKLGYNAAQDLLGKLGMLTEDEPADKPVDPFE